MNLKTKERKIRFYPGTHTYYIGRTKLDSVTTFISKFFAEFNEKEIASKLKWSRGQYKGMSQRAILNKWQEDRDHGTRVHALIESLLNGKKVNSYEYEKDYKKFLSAELYLIDKLFPKMADIYIGSEEIIYNESLKLAGTIDVYVENEDGSISLFDWKTNEKIDTENFKWKTAKEPISEYQDCKYIRYSLQLNIYAYMLEKQGHIINELHIVHLGEDGYTDYPVSYKPEVVERLLRHDGRLS